MAAVLKNPESDLPRLIYADWLDEQGDARGEWIRIQCALARLSQESRQDDSPVLEKLRERQHQLADMVENHWVEPIRPWIEGWEFHRGFLERITITAELFLKFGEKILNQYPIRRVRLLDAAPIFPELVRSPLLKKIHELDLCNSSLGNGGPNLLARCESLDQLEFLDLSFNNLSDEGLECLAKIPSLHQLRCLNLNDNSDFSARGIRCFTESKNWNHLERLDLSGNELTESAIHILLNKHSLPKLKNLLVHHGRIGDGGLHALVHSSRFLQAHLPFTDLDIRYNHIGPEGMRLLASSPLYPKLKRCLLSGNPVTDIGLYYLMSAQPPPKLIELQLANCQISDEGLEYLSTSPILDTLEKIDLTDNLVSEISLSIITAIASGKNWRKSFVIHMDSQKLPGGVLRWHRRFWNKGEEEVPSSSVENLRQVIPPQTPLQNDDDKEEPMIYRFR